MVEYVLACMKPWVWLSVTASSSNSSNSKRDRGLFYVSYPVFRCALILPRLLTYNAYAYLHLNVLLNFLKYLRLSIPFLNAWDRSVSDLGVFWILKYLHRLFQSNINTMLKKFRIFRAFWILNFWIRDAYLV